MATTRLVFLDAGPLGLVASARGTPAALRCQQWARDLIASGVRVVIPEIADYEVRRELLRAGADSGLVRLDNLRSEMQYAPISTAVMREAARLWADARRRGMATADDRALDGDVIVAAQARLFVGERDTLTIATDNPDHLSRCVDDARPWKAIGV
jgi:predicted nucleic acid-binding protein